MSSFSTTTSTAAGSANEGHKLAPVTLVWFIVWLICNNVGDKEPLTFDPVNWWAGLLLLTVAIDLAGGHARRSRR
jgi:hypothetical protein